MAKPKIIANHIMNEHREMFWECFPNNKDNKNLKLTEKEKQSIILAMYSSLIKEVGIKYDYDNLCKVERKGEVVKVPTKYFKRKQVDIQWLLDEIKTIVNTNHLK